MFSTLRTQYSFSSDISENERVSELHAIVALRWTFQIVLGWLINTRLLIICLPPDKFRAWSNDIRSVLGAQTANCCNISASALDSLIGRLTHASFVVPLATHFLNRLRSKLNKFNRQYQNRQASIKLTYEDIEDLKLWSTCDGHSVNTEAISC